MQLVVVMGKGEVVDLLQCSGLRVKLHEPSSCVIGVIDVICALLMGYRFVPRTPVISHVFQKIFVMMKWMECESERKQKYSW